MARLRVPEEEEARFRAFALILYQNFRGKDLRELIPPPNTYYL